MGESVSPGPESTQDDTRQWAVAAFKQHETILKDVFTRLAGDNMVLTQRMDTPERANIEAAQVVHTAVANVEAAQASACNVSAAADNALRQELSAFTGNLKVSEELPQTVHHNFGGHVAGASEMLEVKPQQPEATLNVVGASSPGAAAATFREGMANFSAAQAYELTCMGLAAQGLAEEQVKAGTLIASPSTSATARASRS